MSRRRADRAAACRVHAVLSLAVAVGVAATTGCLTREARGMGRARAGRRELRYGFRYDPMEFVENDRSLQGALVRTQVFLRPAEGDEELIRQGIGKVLSEQLEDGSFESDPGKTAGRIRRALGLGCAADDARVQRGLNWILDQLKKTPPNPEEALGVAGILCLTGHGRADEIQGVLDWYREGDRDRLVASIAADCPWSLTGRLRDLWACRSAEGMDAPLKIMLNVFSESVTEAGTMCFVDTGGLIPVMGARECPGGSDIIERMVPTLIRAQRPDGGWGDGSLVRLRALVNHGLLEKLRALPPQPPDWKVARALRLPADSAPYGLTWGGGSLWVCDRTRNEAMAISPDDGSIRKAIPLPAGPGMEIGWWEGSLVHAHGVHEPNPRQPDTHKLFLIDPRTGDVTREFSLDWLPRVTSATQVGDEQYGDRIWLVDHGYGVLHYLDPRTGEHDHGPDVAAANIKRVFTADQGVWFDGWDQPMLIKSDRNGWRLLDYADRPFAGPTDFFSHPGPGYCDGMVWDGRQLWALDARNKRLCVIEKTASGREITDSLAAERK